MDKDIAEIICRINIIMIVGSGLLLTHVILYKESKIDLFILNL